MGTQYCLHHCQLDLQVQLLPRIAKGQVLDHQNLESELSTPCRDTSATDNQYSSTPKPTLPADVSHAFIILTPF